MLSIIFLIATLISYITAQEDSGTDSNATAAKNPFPPRLHFWLSENSKVTSTGELKRRSHHIYPYEAPSYRGVPQAEAAG
jgi:hypothetical protein